MHRQLSFYAKLFFGAALLSRFAIAESTAPKRFKPAQKHRKEIARKFASLQTAERASKARIENLYRPQEPTFQTRIGLSLGLSSLDSANGSPATPTLGLNVDFQAMKYLGAELEAFFDVPMKKETDYSQAKGALGNIKGQLPLTFGSVRFVPKLGVGYGFHRLAESAAIGSEVVSIAGPYATAGFELAPIGDFVFMVDYAMTFGSTGTIELADEFETIEGDLSQTKIERVRIGGYYRLTPQLRLGAQYTRRALKYDLETTEGSSSSAPVQSQIQALVIYEL